MRFVRGSKNFPRDAASPAVTLGNFDGVHLGHRRIIEETCREARSKAGTSVLYTFDPHPVGLLAPAERPPLIQTLEQRLHTIEALEIDICVVEPFTKDLASLSAENFLNDIVVARLHSASVIVGYDFTFGLHRHGTADLLTKFGRAHGIGVQIIEPQFAGETLISSTNIRRLVRQGDVKEAASLLGRNHVIAGKVVSGHGLGGKLNAHTANIESINELIPGDGVYITRTILAHGPGRDRTAHPSVTSIGMNPTFHGAPFAIETHLIDMKVDLLGQTIGVEFLEKMRDQVAFRSTDELKDQISRDIDAARIMHEKSCAVIKSEFRD